MKIIETTYNQYIKAKKHMNYKYLNHYFQDRTPNKFCFLQLHATYNSAGKLECGQIDEINTHNTKGSYGVSGVLSIEDVKSIMDLATIPKVYDFFATSFDYDMKLQVINLLNEDIAGVLIPIYLKYSEKRRTIDLLMIYLEETLPNLGLIKKAITTGNLYSEFPVFMGILMAEVVFLSPLPQFKDELNLLKPKVSSDENVFNFIMAKLKFPNSRTLLTVANTKYEGQENHGVMILYKVVNTVHYNLCKLINDGLKIFNSNPEDTNIAALETGCQIKFKEACSLNWQNGREVRKYLEMTNKETALVIAGYFRDFPNDINPTVENNWKVYGLSNANFKEYNAKVSFYGDKGFEICFSNERILYDGVSYQFFRKDISNNIISNQIQEISFLTNNQKNLISKLIKEASKQNHGTMLVFHAEASTEAERLGKCKRALELKPIQLENELDNLVPISSIDGALIIDFDGVCYALGAILDGKASENSKRGRGARYNSGLSYVETQKQSDKKCLVVVISEDESIDILI